MTPYPRLCRETQEKADAARCERARKAFRTLLFWVGAAVFGAIVLVLGLVARGDNGTWRVDKDVVDAVEVGTVYDGNGCITLVQLVWWCEYEHGQDVCDWRIMRPGMEPERRGAWYVSTFIENDRLVQVWARARYYSHLQHDSELVRRGNFEVERRRKIGGRQ